jgi:type II restriction/modification system DNA methylase subunit YeeA
MQFFQSPEFNKSLVTLSKKGGPFRKATEKGFECLVYLHRYNEGTLSRMRAEYVTPLMDKYEHHHSSLEQDILEGSTEQKRLAEKALKGLEKKQAELLTFDEQLKHHAEKRITLDLDDGVNVNYGKFGNLLADVKAIHGVAVK